MSSTKKTPAMVLNEVTKKLNKPAPIYELMNQVIGSHTPEFIYKVEVLEMFALGKGRTKKEAKHIAALKVLTILEKQHNIEIKDNFGFEPKSVFLPSESDDGNFKPFNNFIGELRHVCLLYKIAEPEFVEISAVGPSHALIFTIECRIGDSLLTRATESKKKLAKQVSAKLMLEQLKNLHPEIFKVQEETLSIYDKTTEVIKAYNESPLLKKFDNPYELLESSIGHNLLDENSVKVEKGCFKESLVGNNLLEEENSVNEEKEWFKPPYNQEKLDLILEKKSLKSCYEYLGEGQDVKIIALEVISDFKLCTLAMGKTIELAKAAALQQMFAMLKNYFSE